MTRAVFAVLGTVLVGVGLGVSADTATQAGQHSTRRPAGAATRSGLLSSEAQNRLVGEYCSVCHDDEVKPGGVSLEHFDAARIDQHAELAERMIRKLRAGMMPPPQATSRPSEETIKAFAATLEARGAGGMGEMHRRGRWGDVSKGGVRCFTRTEGLSASAMERNPASCLRCY